VVEHPFVYEINTWVWLEELRARLGKKIGLAGVPLAEWKAIVETDVPALNAKARELAPDLVVPPARKGE